MKALASLCAVIALTSAVPARADTCDDILAAFNKAGEELMKREAKGGALCTGMGEVIGLMNATKIVAGACSKEAIAKDMDDSVKAMREGMQADCK